MAYTVEFPSFDPATMPQIPAGFKDQSWCNDVCPSFYSAGLDLSLWVDFADPDQRELPNEPRFAVAACGDPNDHVFFNSDDWSQVLCVIAFVAAGFSHEDRNGGQK